MGFRRCDMQIHYFQRYHSKENVDTSNTMLMLSRLYNYNADKFFSMLNSLILGEDESPEITFDLQVVVTIAFRMRLSAKRASK